MIIVRQFVPCRVDEQIEQPHHIGGADFFAQTQ